MNNETMNVTPILLAVIVVALTVSLAWTVKETKNKCKQTAAEVNETWMQQLEERGLIIRNDHGSFVWTEE